MVAHRLLIAAGFMVANSGCALAPNTIRTEVSHMSHLSQHFGSHRTNFGAEYAQVIAQWRWHGLYAELGEGYNLSQDSTDCHGGICGPRELSTATVGYVFEVRP